MTFGNNGKGKICGQTLGNSFIRIKNVFYIKALKHNLLRISQSCDGGHKVISNQMYAMFFIKIVTKSSLLLIEKKCLYCGLLQSCETKMFNVFAPFEDSNW